jgi:hypothetical protein
MWRGAPFAVVAVVGLAVAAALALRRCASRVDLMLLCFASAGVVAALLLPFSLGVWKFFSPRFLPLTVSLGALLLPIERLTSSRLRRLVVVGCMVVSASSLAWSGWYHRRLVARAADILAGLTQPIARGGRTLPIILDPGPPGVAYCEPFINLGHLFVIEQGGMNPFLFATTPSIHPVLYNAPVKESFPPQQGRFYHHIFRSAGRGPGFPPADVQLQWLGLLGSRYDDVILFVRRESDIEPFVKRGFSTDYRKGKLFLGRFKGCGLTVRLESSAPIEHAALIEYGWFPVLDPAERRALPPLGEEGEVRFEAAPCGRVFVRVAVDQDDSHGFSRGDLVCKGADAEGRLVVDVSETGAALVCTLAPDARLERETVRR